MQLIYVDDYGNTGRRLDDPKQPLFMLFAVLIDESKWIAVERELNEVTYEIATRCGIDPTRFKLHAWEFFSQYRFKQLTFDERAAYAYRVAQIVERYEGEYVACYVQKATLQLISQYVSTLLQSNDADASLKAAGIPEQDLGLFQSMATEVMGVICDPYAFVFADLIGHLESRLEHLDARGLIIIDRQEEYASLNAMRTLIALRRNGTYRRLLEQPLQGSGVINVALQITDILGYITGGFLNLAMNQKRFPERHRPTETLIRQRLTLNDSIARFAGRSLDTSGVMTMLTEMALSRLGIPFDHQRITEAMLEASIRLPPLGSSLFKINQPDVLLKFMQHKKGEERPSGLEPQDG